MNMCILIPMVREKSYFYLKKPRFNTLVGLGYLGKKF